MESNKNSDILSGSNLNQGQSCMVKTKRVKWEDHAHVQQNEVGTSDTLYCSQIISSNIDECKRMSSGCSGIKGDAGTCHRIEGSKSQTGESSGIKSVKQLEAEHENSIANGNSNGLAENEVISENEKKSWKEILLDYSQETSFHGIRPIVEPQPFIFRRFIWLCVFVASVVILLLQFGLSVKYYISWPVSVDVKINYNDTITFPAVTLCNENAFRTTEAFHDNYFFLLSELFGGFSTEVDLGKYKVKELSLQTLYETTAHNKSDFIVSCHWQSTDCVLDEFVESLTDFGLCYTYNSGQNNYGLRKARSSGAEGGLRLQLNIEQYQYMHGPNEGAGIKVLIHSYDEIPLVRDHGLAVPPGSHASIAVKAVEVNNLEPKHGKCNDSVELEYFDLYSVASCYTNCKETFLREKCGCRDIYMPENDGKPIVCTLESYQGCMLDALEKYNKYKDNCECPVPCHRLVYEPLISYASTSNFDIDTLLQQEEMTKELKESYVYAREIGQKVERSIIEEDKRLIYNFYEKVKEMSSAINKINAELVNTEDKIDYSYGHLQQRVKIHFYALSQVSHVTDSYFLRGWERFKERILNFVTFDFTGLAMSMKRAIQTANESIDISDQYTRQFVFAPVDITYNRRLTLINQTMDYLDVVVNAYTRGIPLIPLKNASRYEHAFVSVSLTNPDETFSRVTQAQDLYKVILNIKNMSDSLQKLQLIGKEYVETGLFNETAFENEEARFIKSCELYNFKLHRFTGTVIYQPQLTLEEDTTAFKIKNRTLYNDYSTVKKKITEIKVLMKESKEDYWKYVLNIAELSMAYINNPYKLGKNSKTILAEVMTSAFTQKAMQQLQSLLNSLNLKMGDLQSGMSSLQLNYEDIWNTLITYKHTQLFYKAINEDIQLFIQLFDRSEYWITMPDVETTTEIIPETTTQEYGDVMSCHETDGVRRCGGHFNFGDDDDDDDDDKSDGKVFNFNFGDSSDEDDDDNSDGTVFNFYFGDTSDDNVEDQDEENFRQEKDDDQSNHSGDTENIEQETTSSSPQMRVKQNAESRISSIGEGATESVSWITPRDHWQRVNKSISEKHTYVSMGEETSSLTTSSKLKLSNTNNENGYDISTEEATTPNLHSRTTNYGHETTSDLPEFGNNYTQEIPKEYIVKTTSPSYTENNLATESQLTTTNEELNTDSNRSLNYEEYLQIFSDLLDDKNIEEIHILPTENLIRMVNGDLYQLNVTTVLADVENTFGQLMESLNIVSQVAESDEDLLESYENYLASLRDFLQKNEINPSFYRENFMHLDIYMQELRYEEITQQKAYDIIQLLGDIGGSMGLFIGGSFISIIEFIDVFLHNGAKRCLDKKSEKEVIGKQHLNMDENDKDSNVI